MSPSADPAVRGGSTRLRTELRPFTPVPDSLTREVGAKRALIVGRIWRFSQMEQGRCIASLATIARGVGMSRGTVMRHLQWLCANEYVIDTTPGVRSRPHAYEIGERAGGLFSARSPYNPEAETPENAGEAERDAAPSARELVAPIRDAGVSVRDEPVQIRDTGTADRDSGVSVWNTKREVKKDSKRDSKKHNKRGNDAARRARQIPAVALFHSVTGRYPPRVNFEEIEAAIARIGSRLGRYPTREDLLPFYRAWTARGYNTGNLAWLEWAEGGEVPGNAKAAARQGAASAIERWAHGNEAGDRRRPQGDDASAQLPNS
jgi:hypothetical protein